MALRLSFADRDACAAALSNHYAEGRIDGQELERRLTMLFQAVTRGDLRPVFEGLVLPRLPTEVQPQLVASRAVVVFSIVLGITLPFAALGTIFLVWGSDDGDRKGGLVVLGIVAIVLAVTWWRTLRRSTIRIWAGW